MDYKTELQTLIEALFVKNGSDLHLNVDNKPILRVNKELEKLTQKETLSQQDLEAYVDILLEPTEQEALKTDQQILFSYKTHVSNGEEVNLRGNVYIENGKLAVALRIIPLNIKTIQDLNLPPILEKIARQKQGFFLLAGPAGHGKSTTIAAMINYINEKYAKTILTIEDPIEFLYKDGKSIISQREVPGDIGKFIDGLNNALRADIDVLMIGEMRETETMRAAITAAEVGHLVLSTVHSNSASRTINRIVDAFPPEQHDQILTQLSYSLLGVCSMKLLPSIDGTLVPVCEIMLVNRAISNLIQERKYGQIDIVIETSSQEGMVSFERALAELVRENKITLETAYEHSRDRRTLEKYI